MGTIIPQKDSIPGMIWQAMINNSPLHRPEDYSHQINENRRKNGDRVSGWSGPTALFAMSRVRLHDILCVGNDITDRKTFRNGVWKKPGFS
jgi:hypothetical protein